MTQIYALNVAIQDHFRSIDALTADLRKLYYGLVPDSQPYPRIRFYQLDESPQHLYSGTALSTWSYQFDIFDTDPERATRLLAELNRGFNKAQLVCEEGQVLSVIRKGSRMLTDPETSKDGRRVVHALSTFELRTQ